MKKLLLIGGGGHCSSVIDSLLNGEMLYDKIAVIDMPEKYGEKLLGIDIVGSDDNLEKLYEEGYKYAFITLGSVGNPSKRIATFARLREIGFMIPNVIDKSAIVSLNVHMGNGIYVGKNVVVNTGAQLGDCCIVNTASVIEHNCRLGKFVHMAPGSVMCGDSVVGDNSHIGANSTVIQGIHVADNCIIGAGTVIVKDVLAGTVIVGNPGRRIR